MKLPNILANTEVPDASMRVRADASDFASFTRADAAQIQSGLDNASGALHQRSVEDAKLWVAQTSAQAEKDWIERSATWRADSVGSGFAKQVDKDYTGYMQSLVKTAPNGIARNMLQRQLTEHGLSIFRHAMTLEARANVKARGEAIRRTLVNRIAPSLNGQAPATPEVAEEVAQTTSSEIMSASPLLSLEDQSKLKEATASIFPQFAQAQSEQSPQQFIADAEGGKWDGKIPEPILQGRIATAKSEIGVRSKVAQWQQDDAFKSYIAQISEEGTYNPNFNRRAFASAHRDVQLGVAKLEESEQNAMLSFQAKSELYGKSPEEMAAVIDKFAPKADSGNDAPGYDNQIKVYNNLRTTAAKYLVMLHKDPYSYAEKSPTVRSASREAENAWQAARNNPLDPSFAQTAAQAEQRKIQSVMAVQDRVGVPIEKRQVVSTAEAESMVGDLQSKALQDPSSIPNQIAGLQAKFGSYFPTLMRQLSSGKNGLDYGFQLTAALQGKPFARDFVAALADKSKRSVDANGQKIKNQDLSETLFNSPELEDFRRSLVATTPNARDAYDKMEGALSDYASYLQFTGRASNTKQAARLASKQIIGSLYGFSEVNGVPTIIPRKLDGEELSDSQVSVIGSRMKDELYQVTEESNPEGIDVFTPALLNQIRSNGYWVTTPDYSGAQLMMQSGAAVAPVKNKDGKNITRKFKDMLEKGTPIYLPPDGWWNFL